MTADPPLVYTLTVSNSGANPADDTILTDAVPAHVIFGSASDGGTYDPGTGLVTWELGSIAPGSQVSETLTVTPIGPEPAHDRASVTTTTFDPTTPDTASLTTRVRKQPNTEYTKVSDASFERHGATGHREGLRLGETMQWNFLGRGRTR